MIPVAGQVGTNLAARDGNQCTSGVERDVPRVKPAGQFIAIGFAAEHRIDRLSTLLPENGGH